MKLKMKSSDLKKVLGKIDSNVSTSDATHPGFKIVTIEGSRSGDRSGIRATALNAAAAARIMHSDGVEVTTPGKVALDAKIAKMMSAALSTSKTSSVSIELKEDRTLVIKSSDMSTIKLPIENIDNAIPFPKQPDAEDGWLSVEKDFFSRVASKASQFCCSMSEGRPNLSHVSLVKDMVTATNGHVIIRMKESWPIDDKILVLPAFFSTVSSCFEEDTVKVLLKEDMIWVKSKTSIVACRIAEKTLKHPPLDQLIYADGVKATSAKLGQTTPGTAKVSCEDMASASKTFCDLLIRGSTTSSTPNLGFKYIKENLFAVMKNNGPVTANKKVECSGIDNVDDEKIKMLDTLIVDAGYISRVFACLQDEDFVSMFWMSDRDHIGFKGEKFDFVVMVKDPDYP